MVTCHHDHFVNARGDGACDAGRPVSTRALALPCGPTFALEVGAELGVVNVGLKALSSLRLEKGYRDYGHDMVRALSFLYL